MKRVILECKGRLANQVLCWANAVHVFEQLGIANRLIVVNYPELSRAMFPANTAVESVPDASALPRVRRNAIAKQEGDCLWIWEDVYADFPDAETMKRIIRKIIFPYSCAQTPDYCVGLHVRYGDYVAVDPSNPPDAPPPFIRASNDYFLSAVRICREIRPCHTFFVSSDGTDEELAFLTSLPGVTRRPGNADALHDLFALSQCRLIIGSNSTFSHVASYYGDVPLTSPSMSEAEIRAVISLAL